MRDRLAKISGSPRVLEALLPVVLQLVIEYSGPTTTGRRCATRRTGRDQWYLVLRNSGIENAYVPSASPVATTKSQL